MKKHLITMGILAIAYGVGCGGGEDNTLRPDSRIP